MADVEAQGNGRPGADESKALTDEKVPQVKIATAKTAAANDDDFRGLTKEELLRYANDPSWVRLRWVLFIAFWLIWLAMLVASVVIIVYAPKCPSPAPKVWWQKGPIYKLDLASFRDSDDNGMGDIKGLTEKLDYLVDTGINTVLISTFLKGSVESNGDYAVVDYMAINADLGTKADWDQLVEQLKTRNIKVIIDLPADRTSSQHEWFELSAARDADAADMYLWQDNADNEWVMNQDRGQAYYAGSGALPQLNVNNTKVREKMDEILKYWMDSGVDGFNIDSYTSTGPAGEDKMDYIKHLRSTIDAYSKDDSEDDKRILISFGNRPASEAKSLYGPEISEIHVGSFFHLVSYKPLMATSGRFTADDVIQYVESYNLTQNAWPTFSVSGPGGRVAASEPDMVDGMNMLSLMLPATPVFKNGDELGIDDGVIDWSMQANQTKAAKENRLTHYTVFSSLKDMRHQKAIHFGVTNVTKEAECLVLMRVKKGNPGYLLVINFNESETTLDLSKKTNIAENLRILVSSVNGLEFSLPNPEAPKSFPSKALVMEARQAKIFTFVPVF